MIATSEFRAHRNQIVCSENVIRDQTSSKARLEGPRAVDLVVEVTRSSSDLYELDVVGTVGRTCGNVVGHHPHRSRGGRVGLLGIDDQRKNDNDDCAEEHGSSEPSSTHANNPSPETPPPPGKDEHRASGGRPVNARSRQRRAPAAKSTRVCGDPDIQTAEADKG